MPLNAFGQKNWRLSYRLKSCLALGSLLSLVACQSLPPAPETFNRTLIQQQYNEQQHQLRQSIQYWQLSGKTSITLPNNKRVTAFVNWTQQNSGYQIDLRGPLGQGHMRIKSTLNPVTHSTRVTLETAHKTVSAHSAAELLFSETGLALPVESLYWWLRGLPDPSTHYVETQIDNSGLTSRFTQTGWHIHFNKTLTIPIPDSPEHSVVLPTQLIMTHQDFLIKWVIKRWEVSSTETVNTDILTAITGMSILYS